MPEGKWEVIGFDTFEGEYYELLYDNVFATEEKARLAAKKQLEVLEKTQPSEQSGGQELFGIQDQIYIVRPNGSKYRFFG